MKKNSSWDEIENTEHEFKKTKRRKIRGLIMRSKAKWLVEGNNSKRQTTCSLYLGNGSIDRNELKIAITACMEESSLSFSDDKVEALTEILFESADNDASGKISYDELANDGLQWVSPPKPKKTENSCSRHLSSQYFKKNALKIVYFIIYLLLNVALGVYAGWTYRKSKVFIIIARISGLNLNFNCSIICVPMLKMLLTKIRDTKVSKYLPLNSFLGTHKMIAVFIAIYSIVHTVAHIGNACKYYDVFIVPLNQYSFELFYFTQIYKKAVLAFWFHFQLFYFTHMLYIYVCVCLILHGPHFWKWFLVPGTVFIIEKLIRTKIVQSAGLGNMYTKEVDLLPAGVIHLVIHRPDNFKYKPGDYCFLNIQNI
ncbi:hypothetical protein KUTeg_009007 [Tegillarca granosa]|uniref:FAD-binding 8 domain-containing protein n=1 Tax=Tegillarca granosa TaxID=220873 RepID=A0ABQ9F9Z2_TEGGR|nr:hypothetical protein KUTeg_009007 [Tegillarca granosa]